MQCVVVVCDLQAKLTRASLRVGSVMMGNPANSPLITRVPTLKASISVIAELGFSGIMVRTIPAEDERQSFWSYVLKALSTFHATTLKLNLRLYLWERK